MKKFPDSKFPITPITDESTYLHFCEWVEEISDMEVDEPKEQEKQFAWLDTLTTLIEAYEEKHFKINQKVLTPVQVIEQAMEQLNMSKKELALLLGANRVSEIFSGKRDLSLAQIRKLHHELRIPTDLLIGV